MGYRATALAICLVLVLAIGMLHIFNAQSASSIQITFKVSTSGLTVTPTTVSAVDNAGASLTSVTVLWGDHTQSYWTAADGPLSTFFTAHAYPAANAYTITIIADDSGDNSQTVTEPVTVTSPSSSASTSSSSSGSSSPSQPPISLIFQTATAGLTVTPTSVSAIDNAGLPLTSVTVSWGDNVQSQWTASDGPISTFFGPHTYSGVGAKTITVTAFDSADHNGIITEQVTLSSGASSSTTSTSATSPPILLTFKATVSNLLLVPTTISAIDTSGTSLTSVTVLWGDGTQSQWVAGDGPISSFFGPHTYQQSGSSTITMTAVDSADASNTITQQFTIGTQNAPATSTTSSSAASAQSIQISVTASAKGLTVTPSVNINDPNANSGATLTEVDLSWGDGTSDAVWIANGYSIVPTFAGSHTYQSSGPYTITVTAMDSTNAQGSASQPITVSNGQSPTTPSQSSQSSPTSPTITTSFTVPISGLTVTPALTISDPNLNNGAGLTSVSFSWGDGSPDAQWIANGYGLPASFPGPHTYASGGPYTLTLSVEDSALATGTSAKQITLGTSSNQGAATAAIVTTSPSSIGTTFTISPVSGLAVSGLVNINDQNINSGASLTSVVWDWGDGTSSVWTASSGADALSTFPGTHTYKSTGSYPVSETVTDSAGEKGTAMQQVSIPPSASTSPSSIVAMSTVSTSGLTITPDITVTDPNVNSGASIVSEDWSWGDGTPDAVWTGTQSFSGSDSNAANSPQNILAPVQPQAPPSTFPGPHTYANPGSYQVSALIADSKGGTGTAIQQVLVESMQESSSTTTPTPPPPQSVLIHGTITSTYSSGSGFSATTGAVIPYSPVSAVNSMNAQTALWLLTCPDAPTQITVPPDPSVFFYRTPQSQSPIYGGDECAVHPTTSTVDLATLAQFAENYYGEYSIESQGSGFGSYEATTALPGTPLVPQPTGTALISINGLGFTSQVDGAVSDTFSKQINIFQQSQANGDLHALWTWFSEVPYMTDQQIQFSPVQCDKHNKCHGYAQMSGTVSTPYEYDIGTAGQDYSSSESCTFPTYTYSSQSQVSGFANSYIPYTQANGGTPTATFQAMLLPYINYQISIPSLFGQTLQLPYYVFSPSSYSNPANNLDALPITIGSEFFVNYKNTLQIGTQSGLFQWTTTSGNTITDPHGTADAYAAQQPGSSNPAFCILPKIVNNPDNPNPGLSPYIQSFPGSLYCNYCQANPGSVDCQQSSYLQYLTDCTGPTYVNKFQDNFAVSLAQLTPTPAFCQPFSTVQPVNDMIPNPISIASLPTDYTFVLSQDSSGGYSVYVFQTIPKGKYDVGAPSVPTAPTSAIWDAEWQQYWQQVIQTQNDNNYLVTQIPVSSDSFTPINMTVDYAGDIFLTGVLNPTDSPQPAIEEITSPTTTSCEPSIQPQAITTTSTTGLSYDQIMPEIAASPSGQYVFLANQSDGGYVYEYSVSSTATNSQQPSSCQQGVSTFTPYDQISLAYQAQDPTTQQTSMLNIVYWLENNGLYNQNLQFISNYIGSYSTSEAQQIAGNTLETDNAIYHHPISIQDVNGYLYVEDNWAGALDIVKQDTNSIKQDTNCIFCTYQGVFFSTLMVRAINSTGLSVPINPTLFNDLYKTAGGQCSTSPSVLPTTCFATAQSETCVPAQNDKVTQCPQVTETGCNIPGSTKSSPKVGYSYLCTTPSAPSSTNPSLSVPAPYTIATYPPYGWIISANVIAGTLANQPGSGLFTVQYDPSQSYSICATSQGNYACNLNPTNENANQYTGTFQPIGPHILALDQQATGACFLYIFNCNPSEAIQYPGDIRGAFSPYYYDTGFSVGFNESLSMLFTTGSSPGYSGYFNIYQYTADNPNSNNALILTNLNIQNYTQLFQGSSNPTCYTSDPNAAFPNSNCQMLNAVENMQPPVYNMPDPLAYLESLGGSQQLTLGEAIGSSSPAQTSSSTSSLKTCAQSIASTGITSSGCSATSPSTEAACARWIDGGEVGTAPLGCTVPATQQSSLIPLQQSITVTISGSVLVPYSYAYSQSQSWSNFADGTCITTLTENMKTITTTDTGQSRGSPYISPPSTDSGVYYTAAASPTFTNTIIANIDGGATYLQDQLNNYYRQNLSDIGQVLTTNPVYTVDSNRQFSDVLINMTTNPLHSGIGNQYILNDTHQTDYQVTTYAQGSSPGYQGYQTISSVPANPIQYGTAAAVNTLSNTQPSSLGFVNQNYLGANTVFSYTPQLSTFVTLFQFYISEAFSGTHNFAMTNTLLQGKGTTSQYQALGYNRLLYIFRDTFNNTFTAPIDADIAEPSAVSYTVTPTVSPTNPNQTILAISGTLTYSQNGNTYPIPNNQIYVYYNHNLNYVNYNPLSGDSQQVINAQLCAGSTIPPSTTSTNACAQANPLNPSAQQATEAQQVTYAPAFNAMGTCGPAPQALLTPQTYNCNINKLDGLLQTCPASQYKSTPQYCMPLTADGSGICTSQVGLIGVTTTDSNGAFSLSTTACGIGSVQLNATYYGFASPEPTTVSQTPLALASAPGTTCATITSCITTQVLNYYYSPFHQVQSVPLGLFELSYGDIGIAVLLASIGTAILALLYRRR